jgi:hypothetical protein
LQPTKVELCTVKCLFSRVDFCWMYSII